MTSIAPTPRTTWPRRLQSIASSVCLGAIVLGVFSLPALSADFTLKQLLEIGADRHPSVLQARNQAQAAGFDVESAKWGRFPTVSSQLRSDTNLSQSLAKVEQPLWTGGKLTSRIELSEANLRTAEAGVCEAEFNALTQVATAFFEALRLERRLQSAILNVTEHERLVGLIKRRSEAEISPPADTTLAQARLQQAVSERIQIKKQLDASLTTLAQWTVPTHHPRIMKAHEEFLLWEDLHDKLQALSLALDINDVPHIRKQLKDLVPGYQPEGDVVDWVWMENEKLAMV